MPACLSSTEFHSVGPPGRTPSPSVRLPRLLFESPPTSLVVLRRGTYQRAHAGPAQQDSRRQGRAYPVLRMGTPRWGTRGALLVSRMLFLLFYSNYFELWCNATAVILLLLSVSEVFSPSPFLFLRIKISFIYFLLLSCSRCTMCFNIVSY